MTRRDAGTRFGGRLGRRERALLWLATCCVALMPSIYRGGAEAPHPHSFFQFWDDPAATFDHHDDDGSATAHEHRHVPGVAASPCEALTGAAPSRCAGVGGEPDISRIAPFSLPGGTVELLLATILLAAFLVSPAMRRWHYPRLIVRATGLSVFPESPPPELPFAFVPQAA